MPCTGQRSLVMHTQAHEVVAVTAVRVTQALQTSCVHSSLTKRQSSKRQASLQKEQVVVVVERGRDGSHI